MTNRLEKSAGTFVPPAPATAGSPGIPAHYVWESVTTCGLYSSNVTYQWTVPTDGSDPQYIPVATGGGVGEIRYRCVTLPRQRYIPAVVATPPTPGGSLAAAIAATYSLGWTGGARSLDIITGDGYVQFTIAAVLGGIVAGLNDNDETTLFTELEHALYFTAGTVRVIEGGVIKSSVGSYAVNDVFKIDRTSGTVTYYKNGSLIYTSLVSSSGTVFLDTSLYSAHDALTTPSLLETGAPLTGGGATLTASVPGVIGGEGTRPAMGVLTAPRATLVAIGGIATPEVAYGGGTISGFMLGATGLTGEIGGATMVSPRASLFGGEGTGHGSAILTASAATLSGDASEGNGNASMGSAPVTIDATMTEQRIVYVAFDSSMDAVYLLSAIALRSASMVSDAALDAAASATLQRFATMSTTVNAAPNASRISSADITGRDDGFQVWALDYDSLAQSMYEHYNFNSFADLEGVSFGAKADGVYQLEGDRDSGAYIRASADFGRTALGTNLQKRVPYVYAGVSTSGRLVLRVSVDGGKSYSYYAIAAGSEQKVARFDLGHGLKGNYWHFELFNVEGADVDLDTIEFAPVFQQRRIK